MRSRSSEKSGNWRFRAFNSGLNCFLFALLRPRFPHSTLPYKGGTLTWASPVSAAYLGLNVTSFPS